MGICAGKKDDGSVKNDKSQKKEKTDVPEQNGKTDSAPKENVPEPPKENVQEEKLAVTSPKAEEVQDPPKAKEVQDPPQPDKQRPKNQGTINEVTDDYLKGMYDHGVDVQGEGGTLNKIE